MSRAALATPGGVVCSVRQLARLVRDGQVLELALGAPGWSPVTELRPAARQRGRLVALTPAGSYPLDERGRARVRAVAA